MKITFIHSTDITNEKKDAFSVYSKYLKEVLASSN